MSHTFQQTLRDSTLLYSICKPGTFTKNWVSLPEGKKVESEKTKLLKNCICLRSALTRWASSCRKITIMHPEAINTAPNGDTDHIHKETMWWGGREALQDCFPASPCVSPSPFALFCKLAAWVTHPGVSAQLAHNLWPLKKPTNQRVSYTR